MLLTCSRQYRNGCISEQSPWSSSRKEFCYFFKECGVLKEMTRTPGSKLSSSQNSNCQSRLTCAVKNAGQRLRSVTSTNGSGQIHGLPRAPASGRTWADADMLLCLLSQVCHHPKEQPRLQVLAGIWVIPGSLSLCEAKEAGGCQVVLPACTLSTSYLQWRTARRRAVCPRERLAAFGGSPGWLIPPAPGLAASISEAEKPV